MSHPKVSVGDLGRYWRLLETYGVLAEPENETLVFSPHAVDAGHLGDPDLVTYEADLDGVLWIMFGREGGQGELEVLRGHLTHTLKEHLAAGRVVEMKVEFDLMLPCASLAGLPRVARIRRVIAAKNP